MHRLFVAFRLPDLIRDACLDAMEPPVPGWHWQDEDHLHVTLRFIGEVDRRRADDVVAALEAIPTAAVSLAIEGVGWFDQGHRGALFTRVGPRDPLVALHAKIDRALVRIGLEPERRAFLPHITLARAGRGAHPPQPWLERHAGLTSAAAPVVGFDLVESMLGRHEPHYEVAATFE